MRSQGSTRNGPVGLVTRADTSLSDRNVDLLKQWGQEAEEHIAQIPDAVLAGARDVEVFARWHERQGGILRRHRALFHEQVETVRQYYERTLVELAAEIGQVHPTSLVGGTPLADLAQRQEQHNKAYSLRQRAAYLRQILDRAQRVTVASADWNPIRWSTPAIGAVGLPTFGPDGTTIAMPPTPVGVPDAPGPGFAGSPGVRWGLRIPPAARFWLWGPTGTAGGFAQGMLRRGYARVTGAAQMLRGYGAAYLFGFLHEGMGKAEANTEELTALAAQRAMLRPGKGGVGVERAGDPWWSRQVDVNIGIPRAAPKYETLYRRQGDAAVIELRGMAEKAASAFAYTSGEMIAGARALGPFLTGGRLLAASQFSRRMGLAPAEASAHYQRLLTHVHESLVLQVPVKRETWPAGLAPSGEKAHALEHRTDVWPEGSPEGAMTSGSLLLDVNRAMHQAGMRDRPEQFMANVEAVAAAMSAGVGLADSRDAIGLATLFGEAGLGGERWQGLMAGSVGASRARSGEAVTAAKIAAVRRHFAVTLGAGPAAEVVDPRTYLGAMRLIDSGDPRIMQAFAAYARAKSPDDEEFARTIFRSMMPGLSHRDARLVWERVVPQLGRVRSAGKGYGADEPTEGHRPGRGVDPATGRPIAFLDPNERWREGPMMKGPDGTSRHSIARENAGIDWAQYRIGVPLVEMATDIKDAVVTAAEGFANGESIFDAVTKAIGGMPAEAQLILGMQMLAAGGDNNGLMAAAIFGGATYGMARDLYHEAVRDVRGTINAGRRRLGLPVLEPDFGGSDGPAPQLQFPVAGGRVTGHVGDVRGTHVHQGLDVAAPTGTPVVATTAGTLEIAGFEPNGYGAYGNVVVLRHRTNPRLTSLYAHLDHIDPRLLDDQGRPRQGVQVEAGQAIGGVGSTGRSTGPHLHYELRHAGQAIDPRRYFGAQRP